MPIAAPLPTWEDESEEFVAAHPAVSNLDDDFSDEDSYDEKNDDPSEPDPFENFLVKSDEGAAATAAPTSSSNDSNNFARPGKTNGPKRRRNENTKLNPVFCEPSINGVEVLIDIKQIFFKYFLLIK